MCSQISCASSRFAVPEKILKRLSSFETRDRRVCDFAFPSVCAGAELGVAATASIVSVFTRSSSWFAWHPVSHTAMFPPNPTTQTPLPKLWLGDQDSNLDKVLQRHLTYH